MPVVPPAVLLRLNSVLLVRLTPPQVGQMVSVVIPVPAVVGFRAVRGRCREWRRTIKGEAPKAAADVGA